MRSAIATQALTAGLAFAGLAFGACRSGDSSFGPSSREAQRPSFETRLPIDEYAGTVRGVGLRDEQAKVHREFGRPIKRGGSGRIPPDPFPAVLYLPGYYLNRYPGIDFLFYRRTRRVAAFLAYSKRTRTTRGVATGDPLSEVKQHYQADCNEGGQTDEGEDTPASCATKLGPGTYIDFAAFLRSDRVGTIVLSAESTGAPCEGKTVVPGARERCMYEARTGRRAR